MESGSVVVLVSLEDGMVEGESKVAGTWLFRSMAKGMDSVGMKKHRDSGESGSSWDTNPDTAALTRQPYLVPSLARHESNGTDLHSTHSRQHDAVCFAGQTWGWSLHTSSH